MRVRMPVRRDQDDPGRDLNVLPKHLPSLKRRLELHAKISMRKFLCVLLVVATLPTTDAWGGVQPAAAAAAKARKCSFPKSGKRAPDWVCTAHAEGMALTAVGSAPRSRAGIPFMEQMAAADARAHLVQKVRESVQRKLGAGSRPVRADERSGALITRIANDSLHGARIEKRIYGPGGTLYMLVGLDEASANRLIESVTAEYLAQRRR